MSLRIKWAIAAVSTAALLVLAPTASASATLGKTVKGSNPNSPYCKEVNLLQSKDRKEIAAATEVLSSTSSTGWRTVKNSELALLNFEVSVAQHLLAASSHPPHIVQVDGPVIVKDSRLMISDLNKAKSSKELTSLNTSPAFSGPGVKDETAVTQYTLDQCGGIESTSN